MPRVLDPFRFVVVAVAGWMNQHQLQIIDYLANRLIIPEVGHLGNAGAVQRRQRLGAHAELLLSRCGVISVKLQPES